MGPCVAAGPYIGAVVYVVRRIFLLVQSELNYHACSSVDPLPRMSTVYSPAVSTGLLADLGQDMYVLSTYHTRHTALDRVRQIWS